MSITKDFENVAWNESTEITGTYKVEEVDELLAHTRALEVMLKKHERVGGVCPECGVWALEVNHKRDCQLAKLLEGVE